MPDYGVLPEGFVPQTTAEIREEIEENLRSRFGRGFPLGDHTLAGYIVGILSERLGLLWEIAEVCYNGFDPDKATGDRLRSIGLITGTIELPAASSVAVLTLCGDDATVVTQGSLVATSAGKRFSLAESATLVELDAWGTATEYGVGDRVTNLGRCYECVVAGTSDAGPSTTDETITDGSVGWTYLGEGAAAVDVAATSVEIGPVVAVSRDLSEIVTPVAGWASALNLEDARLGRLEQTDESFRLMRDSQLFQPGTGPADAVRAALMQVPGVASVSILFNVEDVTDENGLPPHSCEALVLGGNDQDIWQTLWDNVPLGIQTVGNKEGTVIDSEGREQTLRFSRPAEKPICVKVTLTKNIRTYVGDDEVALAIATWGNTLGLRHDVAASAVSSRAFVTGVLDVTEVLLSVDPEIPASSATLVMGVRDLPLFDTSRITVISSDGEP